MPVVTPKTELERALALERLMTAYSQETQTHLLLVLLVIVIGLLYAIIVDFTVLKALPDQLYYLLIIVTTFTILAGALVTPIFELSREEKRLKAAEEPLV